MKPRHRHAAALALVGWYLMVPPIADCVGSTASNPCKRSRISQWYIETVFDAAADCQRAEKSLIQQAVQQLDTEFDKSAAAPATYKQARLLNEVSAQCIASDDPRLKGK